MPGFRSSERIRYEVESGLSAKLETKPTEAGVSTLFFRNFGLDNGEPFNEQLKQIHHSLKTIRPEDLDDTTLEDVLDRADRLVGLLQRISGQSKKPR
jgi:hypothetical protein